MEASSTKRLTQTTQSLRSLNETYDAFFEQAGRRTAVQKDINEHRNSEKVRIATESLRTAHGEMINLRQQHPQPRQTRKLLGPVFFLNPTSYAQYVPKTSFKTTGAAMVKTFGGITIDAVEHAGFTVGVGMLALTGLQKAVTQDPLRWGLASAALAAIAISYAIAATPKKWRLQTWQQVSYTRVGADTGHKKKLVDEATSALLVSYLDPMYAGAALLYAMILVEHDPWMWGITAGAMVATEIASFYAVRGEGSERAKSYTDKVVCLGAAAQAARAFLIPNEKCAASPYDIETTGEYGVAAAFSVLALTVMAAKAHTDFIKHRSEAREKMARLTIQMHNERVEKAEKNVALLERNRAFLVENLFIDRLDASTHDFAATGDSVLASGVDGSDAQTVSKQSEPSLERSDEHCKLISLPDSMVRDDQM